MLHGIYSHTEDERKNCASKICIFRKVHNYVWKLAFFLIYVMYRIYFFLSYLGVKNIYGCALVVVSCENMIANILYTYIIIGKLSLWIGFSFKFMYVCYFQRYVLSVVKWSIRVKI